MNGKRCCRVSASSHWKTPRQASKSRSTRLIARREPVSPISPTKAKQNSRAPCAGIISTRLPSRLARIICRRCARSSSNVSDGWLFGEFNYVDLCRRRISRYCTTDRLLTHCTLGRICRGIYRTLDYRLDRMQGDVEKMQPYRFSIRVSDILRRYVTEQYNLPVTRQTSVEFLNALTTSSPFSDEERTLLEDFLNRCDLIKFAHYDATPSDSRLLLEEAIRFVTGGQLAIV